MRLYESSKRGYYKSVFRPLTIQGLLVQKVESSVVGSGALSMGSSSRKMWTSSQPPVNSAKCRASHRVWYSGHTCRLSLKNASLESRFTGGYTACKSTLLYTEQAKPADFDALLLATVQSLGGTALPHCSHSGRRRNGQHRSR